MATRGTNRRWSCPRCESGVLAPGKMRKNDARRYCLDCTSKTGKLVERVCAALEKRRSESRARASEEAKSARAAKRDADLKRWSVGTMDLRTELDWMVEHFELSRRPTVSIVRSRSGSKGRAYYGNRRNPGSITLTIGQRSDFTSQCAQLWEYLLHEVIHSFGLPHGAEMCAEIDRACLARWGVDVRSGSQGFPKGRVGKEKTYAFDRVAISAICEAVQKVYTDPPRRPSRSEELKKKWGTNALRINVNTPSGGEVDAVILEPIQGSNDAEPEYKAMAAWVESTARRIGRSRFYVLEVTKETLPHARILVKELNEWAWDARAVIFSRWANLLEDICNRVEKQLVGASLEAAISAPLTRA